MVERNLNLLALLTPTCIEVTVKLERSPEKFFFIIMQCFANLHICSQPHFRENQSAAAYIGNCHFIHDTSSWIWYNSHHNLHLQWDHLQASPPSSGFLWLLLLEEGISCVGPFFLDSLWPSFKSKVYGQENSPALKLLWCTLSNNTTFTFLFIAMVVLKKYLSLSLSLCSKCSLDLKMQSICSIRSCKADQSIVHYPHHFITVF